MIDNERLLIVRIAEWVWSGEILNLAEELVEKVILQFKVKILFFHRIFQGAEIVFTAIQLE